MFVRELDFPHERGSGILPRSGIPVTIPEPTYREGQRMERNDPLNPINPLTGSKVNLSAVGG